MNPHTGQIGHGPKRFAGVPTADSYWKETESGLVVKSGQHNVWKVHLPEELTKAVREKLKPEAETKS